MSQEAIMFKPIVISIRIPVETRKTAKGVVATCSPLDASCAGSSIDEALATLATSLTCMLESCFDRGRFDQLFRSAGYCTNSDESWSRDGRYIDVRVTLTAPHVTLSRAEIDNGIQSALDRFQCTGANQPLIA